VFEFATGILNIDYDYSFKFSFYDGHFLGAWAFFGGFVIHATLKFPKMRRSLKSRSLRCELATGLDATLPEEQLPGDDDPPGESLIATHPGRPTISRRGALALVGGSSLTVFVLTAGQSIHALRPLSLLSPRARSYGSGPNAFQVNRTAAAAGIHPADTGGTWQLALANGGPGGQTVVLSRDQLLAMPLVTADLPIACVEGWSTEQRWTGIRLSDLSRLVSIAHPTGAHVQSLERHGAFATASLSGQQVRSGESLLALQVNGADLSPDHGYPARIIVPAAPGVHNTKWVGRITFSGGG
jgi:DMSO/TMAO reductase YedYZ molybdopterin-dependent catalytic subunit